MCFEYCKVLALRITTHGVIQANEASTAPLGAVFLFSRGGEVASKINRLREYRTAAGLTQEELARRADVPYHTVIRLDSNPEMMPRVDVCMALATALGITIDDLICDLLVPA